RAARTTPVDRVRHRVRHTRERPEREHRRERNRPAHPSHDLFSSRHALFALPWPYIRTDEYPRRLARLTVPTPTVGLQRQNFRPSDPENPNRNKRRIGIAPIPNCRNQSPPRRRLALMTNA